MLLIVNTVLNAYLQLPETYELRNLSGRTYVMITYVSKENNLGPDDKIRYMYIFGLKGPIFIS